MSNQPSINQLMIGAIAYDLDVEITCSVSCGDYNLVFFSIIDFDLFATLLD
jgi:hypothetical protein